MNNIINPDDRDYYDGKLYEVGIWPGAGYQLTTFKVYAAHEQEALELVVADVELSNLNLLMSIPEMEEYIAEDWSEECAKFMQENEDEDADEYTFAEEYLNYIYVDATMQGASQPYFVNGQNLSIKEISENDKVEESKDTQKVFNIKWDTESDGEVVDQKELNLPSETTVPANLSDDEIADYLSDEYGYCVFSYNTENDLKESKEIKATTLKNTQLKSVTEKVEYISRKEYDEMPNEYKTTVKDTIDTEVNYHGKDRAKVTKMYKDLGYDETDPMIMVNDNNGTVLKPVKIQEEKEITLDGEDLTNTFKNYKAFEANFEPIKIVKNSYDKNYKVYRVDEEDANNYIYYSNNKDNIEGWLYGAVQAANGVFKKLTNKNENVNKSILNEEDEETLDEAINRAHQEEISAIDTYDTVLSKTDETTDTKLIDMINEIKADEEDHKLLLQHYIETGEALTDDELEELKNKSSDEDTEIVKEAPEEKQWLSIDNKDEYSNGTILAELDIDPDYIEVDYESEDNWLNKVKDKVQEIANKYNVEVTEFSQAPHGYSVELKGTLQDIVDFLYQQKGYSIDKSIKEGDMLVGKVPVNESKLVEESKQLNKELKHPELNNSIKEYYLNNSTDELGKELNDVTFLDLYRSIKDNYDIYELIGTKDSVVRETLFKELARILNTNYNYVYNMWTYGGVVDGQPNVIKESKQLKENSKDKKAKGISITRAQARDLYDWFLAGDENVGVFKFNNKIDTYRVNSSTGTPKPIYNGTAEYVIDIVDYMKEMTPYYIKNKRDGIDTVYRYVNDEIQSNEAKPQEETLEEAKINNFVDKWKDHNDFKCGWCGTVFKGKIDDNGRMPNCPHCLEDRFADDKEKLDDGYANKDVHFYDTEKEDEIYTDFEGNIVESKCITEALDNSTITEELNTGVLPIVAIDMYSLSDNLNEYDITQEDLDEIAQELAPKYIEDTLKEILPNVSVVTKSVYHPKQYNFEGDELEFDLTVDRQAYETLKENALNNPEFETFLKDNYSTRDGFISAMAYNLDKFKQQPEWKQMVQVIMFNVSDDKIQENNEHYVDEFLERVSMTAGPAIDESKSLTEDNNEEPEFDPSNEVDDDAMNTEFKVGDVVADIVDGDIAIVEALPDKDDGTYTLRFVTGVCRGDAYQYKKGRFTMVKYEDIRKEALEIYNDNMKPADNPLKKA